MEEFEVARMKIIGSTPLKLWLIEAETSNRIFTPELKMRKAFSLNRWLDVLVHVHCCVSMFYHPKRLGTVDVLYFVCSVLEMCCDCELIENSLFSSLLLLIDTSLDNSFTWLTNIVTRYPSLCLCNVSLSAIESLSGSYVPSFRTWGRGARLRLAVHSTVPLSLKAIVHVLAVELI